MSSGIPAAKTKPKSIRLGLNPPMIQIPAPQDHILNCGHMPDGLCHLCYDIPLTIPRSHGSRWPLGFNVLLCFQLSRCLEHTAATRGSQARASPSASWGNTLHRHEVHTAAHHHIDIGYQQNIRAKYRLDMT